jgi:hypothetical protein
VTNSISFPEFGDFKNDFKSWTQVLALTSFTKSGDEILSKYFTGCEITATEDKDRFHELVTNRNFDFVIMPAELQETVGLTMAPLIDLFNQISIRVTQNILFIYICTKLKNGEIRFESFNLDGQTDFGRFIEYLLDLDCKNTEKLLFLAKSKLAPDIYIDQDNYVSEVFCELLLNELLS